MNIFKKHEKEINEIKEELNKVRTQRKEKQIQIIYYLDSELKKIINK